MQNSRFLVTLFSSPSLMTSCIIFYLREKLRTCKVQRVCSVHSYVHLPPGRVSPRDPYLSVPTITSDVTGAVTNMACNANCRRVAVSSINAITSAFIVAKGSIQYGKVAELLMFPLVSLLRSSNSRLDDCLDKLFSLVDTALRISYNETVKRFLGIVSFNSIERPRTRRRPRPSFTEPLPRMAIVAPDSVFISVRLRPRGPRSCPIKFTSGNSFTGI